MAIGGAKGEQVKERKKVSSDARRAAPPAKRSGYLIFTFVEGDGAVDYRMGGDCDLASARAILDGFRRSLDLAGYQGSVQ